MKKTLIYLLMLLPLLVFNSCGDDKDEPQDGLNEQLIGEWEETRADGESTFEIFHYQFFSDGTGYKWVTNVPYDDDKYKITWSTSGNRITIVYKAHIFMGSYQKEETVVGTFSVKGNSLTLNFDGERQYYTRK